MFLDGGNEIQLGIFVGGLELDPIFLYSCFHYILADYYLYSKDIFPSLLAVLFLSLPLCSPNDSGSIHGCEMSILRLLPHSLLYVFADGLQGHS